MLRKPGIKENLFTVPAKFFIVLIVSKFAERSLRNKKRAMCWSLGDFSLIALLMVRKRFTLTVLYCG